MPESIVIVQDLIVRYDQQVAVDGVCFTVEAGEVFGLLGPNGAGKTTTLSVLNCLLPPTSGSAQVAGFDVVREAAQVKRLIGVVPQDLALYPTLSARENLRFFGEMFSLRGKDLNRRVDAVLDIVAMRERANDPIKTYSGGMKRRVNLAVGLINSPRVLFLDEPTVGVDPQSRNHIFESVERLNQEHGMTVLYTTHYMEEAQRLCRRVAIMDRGHIIAQDTPRDLIAMLGGGVLHVGIAVADEELAREAGALPAVKSAVYLPPSAAADTDRAAPTRQVLKIEALRADETLLQLINLLNQRHVEILSMETLEPNLESVFLHLTGKSLRQ
ncbi:MAG: ABC transporter ATP-binding protein [Anaerolineae bacterium]